MIIIAHTVGGGGRMSLFIKYELGSRTDDGYPGFEFVLKFRVLNIRWVRLHNTICLFQDSVMTVGL